MPPTPPLRLLASASLLLILGGAAGVLAGALGPWAAFRLFRAVDVSLPGLFFPWGGPCLAVAALVFLGMRRSPLLCLAGALFVLWATADSQKRVPERVKFQLAGSQLALEASLNRVLDQFHVPDVQVADLSQPNAALLGPGLGWTVTGAYALMLGALAGLPGDPALLWAVRHAVRVRCRACGARRLLARPAAFCPQCGVSTRPRTPRDCPRCGARSARGDRHCAACGAALAAR